MLSRLRAMGLGDPSSSSLMLSRLRAMGLEPTAAPFVRAPTNTPPLQVLGQTAAPVVRTPTMNMPLSRPQAQSPSTPISTTSQHQPSVSEPRLGVAATPTARNGNPSAVNRDPDIAAFFSKLRADAARPWTLEEPEVVRARLLRGPMEGEPGDRGARAVLAMFANSTAQVVQLLAEGDEEVRLRVLARVKRVVDRVMGRSDCHPVFLALLRACEGRFDELGGILDSAARVGKVFLVEVLTLGHGEEILKEFIRVVAPNPNLCETLITNLLCGGLLYDSKGAALLRHCFQMLPYKDIKSIIVQFAINKIDAVLSFDGGRMCLLECFVNATNGELRALENTILMYTRKLAKDKPLLL